MHVAADVGLPVVAIRSTDANGTPRSLSGVTNLTAKAYWTAPASFARLTHRHRA